MGIIGFRPAADYETDLASIDKATRDLMKGPRVSFDLDTNQLPDVRPQPADIIDLSGLSAPPANKKKLLKFYRKKKLDNTYIEYFYKYVDHLTIVDRPATSKDIKDNADAYKEFKESLPFQFQLKRFKPKD